MKIQEFVGIICALTAGVYLLVRLRYELQMMQQNSYRNGRYLRWLKKDICNPVRLLDLLLLILLLLYTSNPYVQLTIVLVQAIRIYIELTKKYKKPLVFTRRAIRLYVTSVLLVAGVLGVCGFLVNNSYSLLLVLLCCIVLTSLVLIFANWINQPMEQAINRKYYREAQQKLAGHRNLIIIGITGSYGKTSTKHYLHRILSEKYNVLMTPGSFNTTLGVVRTIREELKSFHEVFIVEMGAKQPGDIREICELVHPQIGIITSVGEQHLESFKTLENVQKTKFELIDALPAEGIAILNNDFEAVASRKVTNVARVYRYSSGSVAADYTLSDIKYTPKGTEFTVLSPEGETQALTTRIVGSHNLSNILAAYIAARSLDVPAVKIGYAVAHIEQVEHRLNIRKNGAVTVIDDAFNSNPHGAAMALEVLSGFTSGQRIVVTPGMIELGSKQYEYNYHLGEQMAHACDYAIVVGSYNREAIVKGLTDRLFSQEKIYTASSFGDAVSHLNGLLRPGDTVLYENDLPDTFK